jgi:hypothetical protein
MVLPIYAVLETLDGRLIEATRRSSARRHGVSSQATADDRVAASSAGAHPASLDHARGQIGGRR